MINLHGIWMGLAVVLASTLTGYAQFGIVYSNDDYARVLEQYVNADGLVNYKQLQADREKLDFYVRDVAGLYVEMYDGWPEPEQLAFWINGYNALILRAVIDRYPIKSIKNIGGWFTRAWDKLEFMVKGEMLSLNAIERRILGVRFKEPRARLALCPAARGGPRLRSEPYRADALNDQLEEQVRRFLADPEKFRIDVGTGKVFLSPLFKWYGEEFLAAVGDGPAVNSGTPVEQAVLNFISRYISAADRQILASASLSIKYLDYDWSLNKQ